MRMRPPTGASGRAGRAGRAGRGTRSTRSTRGARGALLALAAAGALAALTTGCSKPDDRSEVVTFTDQHGRVCTGVVVLEGDDGDQEVTALDCEYPPEGRSPGRGGYQPLP